MEFLQLRHKLGFFLPEKHFLRKYFGKNPNFKEKGFDKIQTPGAIIS